MDFDASGIDFCNVADFDAAAWADGPLGPASKGVCRCTQNGVCGSGSHVGIMDGKSLVLSNAHVCSTRLGRVIDCHFPELTRTVQGRVILAAYSDRILMDWAVVQLETELDLPYAKLSNEYPVSGKTHYTAGYPRCRGPYYSELTTVDIPSQYGGTLWRWNPNAIGGQSGSGVHSFGDDLQRGLLTWTWGGRGAGQTTRSIWHQYVNRAYYEAGTFGHLWPEGLEELAQNRAEGTIPGVYAEANITQLPIWAHLDPEPDPPAPDDPTARELARLVLGRAEALQEQATELAELAQRYGAGDSQPPRRIWGL